MTIWYNRVEFNTATTGTGSVAVGTALPGKRTPAGASVPNGTTTIILIEDGAAWEVSTSVYNSAGPTMTRVLIESSTGALLNLSGNAAVAIVEDAATINYLFNGSSAVATTPSYVALRATTFGVSIKVVMVTTRGYAGTFIAGASASDNGGTIINDAGGTSWYRVYSGGLNPQWWDGALWNGDRVDQGINAAIAWLKTQPPGGQVELPFGKGRLVAGINASLFGSVFDRFLSIRGQGRDNTQMLVDTAGIIGLDCIGTNRVQLDDFFLGTNGVVASVGLLMARATTTSPNCNGGHINIEIDGAFSVSAVYHIAAESTVYEPTCRFANSNGTNAFCCFYSSGTNNKSVTSPNGTILTSSNTSNSMHAASLYAPFNNAEPLQLVGDAEFSIFGMESLIGSATGGATITIAVQPGTNIFNGPVTIYAPHLEGNTCAALKLVGDTGATNFYNGISILDGYVNIYTSPSTLISRNTSGSTSHVMEDGAFTVKQYNGSAVINLALDGVNNWPIDIVCAKATSTNVSILSFQANQPAILATTVAEAATSVNYTGVSYGTAIPVSGTFAAGHIRYNTDTVSRASYDLMGWECTASGTPGTWSPILRGSARGITAARPGGSPAKQSFIFQDTTLGVIASPDGAGGWINALGAPV